MNSSGIKRGMAALAITAVAVAGIPALVGPAFADSVNSQVNEAPGLTVNDVQLYLEDNWNLSVKNDGTDTSIRLEAGGGDNVEQVRFEYRLTAFSPLTEIATVSRNDDGAFSTEWIPTDAPYNLPFGAVLFSIRAVGLNGGNAIPGSLDFAVAQALRSTGPNINTINIPTDNDGRGFYDATDGACNNGPVNIAVHGTSSITSLAGADRPEIAWMEGDGNAYDNVFVNTNATRAASFGTTWAGVLDVTVGNPVGEYQFSPAFPVEPNEIVVRARTDKLLVPQPDTETDDFESFTLYDQVITTVTAVNTGGNTLPDPAPITITVLDQNGQPVADAAVVRGQNDNPGSSPELYLGQTNGLGQVYTDQAPTANDPTRFYFADQDCNDTFSPAAGDKRSSTVVVDLAGSIAISSNPAGAVAIGQSVTETVTIRNHLGQPIANEVVQIRRTGPGAAQDLVHLTTNASGQVAYTFTCNAAGNVSIRAAFDDPSTGSTNNPDDGTSIYDRFTTDVVPCGIPTPVKKAINPSIKSKNVRGGDDLITVRAKAANGAAVKIYKITGRNRLQLVAQGTLNANGVLKKKVNDTNGSDLTAYKAVVSPTSDTRRGVTNRAQQARTP